MALLPEQEIVVRPKAGQEVLVLAPSGQKVLKPTTDSAMTRARVKISGTYVPPPPPPDPDPDPDPVPEPTGVLWISESELLALPTDNVAFNRIKAEAAKPEPAFTWAAYSEEHAHWVLLNAYVGVRLNSAAIKSRAGGGIARALAASYTTSNSKEIGRNMPEYIIADSVLGGPNKAALLAFCEKLWPIKFTDNDSATGTFFSINRTSPGNGGAMANAFLAAAGIHFDQAPLVNEAIEGLKMFCGQYPGDFGTKGGTEDVWYFHYPNKPLYTPVNPVGSTHAIGGAKRNTDGFIPVEIERANTSLTWPPAFTSYYRITLGGRTEAAEILRKAGLFDAFGLDDKALLRASQAENRLGDAGSDEWYSQTFWHKRVLELRYGVDLGSTTPVEGRGIAGVDWTHP